MYDLISFFVTGVAVPPAGARAANFTGPTVDLLQADGQATLTLFGTLTATATVTMQESDDGTTWTAITTPATTSAISNQLPLNLPITASNTVFEANFARTKRYVQVIITGTGHTLGGTIKSKSKYLGS